MVAACAQVLRDHSLKCPVENVTDIVGTGGDGHDTFNVSTAAAIVAAACGLRVAKVRLSYLCSTMTGHILL
jgi:anthranilate phosphoribosyltransferase